MRQVNWSFASDVLTELARNLSFGIGRRRDDVELGKRAGGGDGGVLIDNGIQSVDIVLCVIGLILHIFVVEGRRNQNRGEEHTVNMFMRTVDGVSADIVPSWSIDMQLDQYIRIFGANGTIHFGHLGQPAG